MRARMVPLLDSAAERGAVMIYLPGFMPSQTPRITRVMPAILDNLERAHIVITDTEALTTISTTRTDRPATNSTSATRRR